MQSKKNSLLEACVSTLIGFVISLVFAPFIFKVCGVTIEPAQMGATTALFTIISVLRGYIIRRFFNSKTDKK